MKKFFYLLLVSIPPTSFAQSSSRFAITRDVVGGGGTNLSGSARFQLGSTVGQALAAVPASTRFSIQGGFWIRPAPILFDPTQIGPDFIISIQSEPGENYTVQYVNSLSTLNWRTLTNLTGNGAVITVTNSAPGVTSRFFRLKQQ